MNAGTDETKRSKRDRRDICKLKIMWHKTSILILILGIIIGFLVSSVYNTKSSTAPVIYQSYERIAVKEDEEICPYKVEGDFPEARISFLPVTVENWVENDYYKSIVGSKFDVTQISKDWYMVPEGSDPWQKEEIDIDGDLEYEQVYYGNTAMNHTPHVAYVVKDGIVVLFVGGASINVERDSYKGINVSETLDWGTGKYKLTRYELDNGKYKPIWYQMSCKIN